MSQMKLNKIFFYKKNPYGLKYHRKNYRELWESRWRKKNDDGKDKIRNVPLNERYYSRNS